MTKMVTGLVCIDLLSICQPERAPNVTNVVNNLEKIGSGL